MINNGKLLKSYNLKRSWWLLDILMVIASLLLGYGSYYAYNYANSVTVIQDKADFNSLVDVKNSEIQGVVQNEINDLYHLRTHFAVTKTINYEGWKAYMDLTELEEANEGKITFLYLPKVGKADTDLFEKETRLESQLFKDYEVRKKGEVDNYFPLKYVYGSLNRFENLLGFDFGSVGAISKAMITGGLSTKEAISEMVDLHSLSDKVEGKGYLILLPIYENGAGANLSQIEKQTALKGFVGLWIEVDDLFMLNDEDKKNNLAYKVSDSGTVIYETRKIYNANLSQKRVLYLVDKDFEMVFSVKTETGLLAYTEMVARPVTWALIIMNTFWYLMIGSFWWLRRRAQRISEDASSDLLKFRQAVDGVSDMVVITNANGKIIYVNSAITKMTGYTMTELEQRNLAWGGLLNEDFYTKDWPSVSKGQMVYQKEITNLRKNGETYQVEFNVWPIKDKEGELVFFVGILKDLSAQKKVEQIKSDFMSLASHQLRTPMSAVKWFAKMLWNGDAGQLTDKQKEYLDNIISSNEREIKVVSSLLNVSRIESGKIKLMVESVDLPGLVSEVVDKLKQSPAIMQKQITVNMSPEISLIETDAVMLRHVYDNLISNAINYTAENGKIEVKVFKDGGMVKTEVSDNGIGIAASEQEKVFSKFYRGSNAVKKVTDGNGLGLFLVKIIVESAKGKIGFVSELNKGSVFWFTLPIKVNNSISDE